MLNEVTQLGQVTAVHLPVLGDIPPAFENGSTYAFAGLAAMAVGAAATYYRDGQMRTVVDEVNKYPGAEEMAQAGKRQAKIGRWTSMAAGVTTSLVVGFGLIAHAGPQDTEVINRVSEVAIVVEGGQDATSAADVIDSDSDDQKIVYRAQAGINAALRLVRKGNEDINYRIIAAGTFPEQIGLAQGGLDEKSDNQILRKAEAYFEDYSNGGEPDISGGLALAAAGAENSKTVLINTNGSQETKDAIGAYKRDMTIISAGAPGTTYDSFGVQVKADFTVQFGAEKAVVVNSTDELIEVVNKISKNDVIDTKVAPNKFYEKVRNILGAGMALGFALDKVTPLKGVKRQSRRDRKERGEQ